ncbi:MAG: DUF2383 domain-containing protein [Myxococcales bacterium]|nr:DUF2383 domain-containing protein [Myxococcales bacterium]MCB9707996.1 DUF2383 domain-containing protein [Myxococcales bacterium]
MLHTQEVTNSIKEDINCLNSFLRGELSAVDTYEQALKHVDNLGLRATLTDVRQSHLHRSDTLRSIIRELGGEPASSAGAWGIFAQSVEGGATLLGESAMIAVLEEGEDHGRRDYAKDVKSLSPHIRKRVETELIPAQKQTHDIISAVKHRKD